MITKMRMKSSRSLGIVCVNGSVLLWYEYMEQVDDSGVWMEYCLCFWPVEDNSDTENCVTHSKYWTDMLEFFYLLKAPQKGREIPISNYSQLIAHISYMNSQILSQTPKTFWLYILHLSKLLKSCRQNWTKFIILLFWILCVSRLCYLNVMNWPIAVGKLESIQLQMSIWARNAVAVPTLLKGGIYYYPPKLP